MPPWGNPPAQSEGCATKIGLGNAASEDRSFAQDDGVSQMRAFKNRTGATLRTGTAGSRDGLPCGAMHKFNDHFSDTRRKRWPPALDFFCGGRWIGGVRLGLGDGFAFVDAGVIVHCGEGAGLHAVNVEGAV
jgi:hypothetical protein